MDEQTAGPVMDENQLVVSRRARYYTIGASGGAVREVWFVLHGYGQLAASFLRSFEALAGGHRLVVAPEALSRFYLKAGLGAVGATWMTREDRQSEIEDYVRYLDALYDHLVASPDGVPERDPVAVQVLGFSQGTATACRWAALGRARIDRLVLWAGDVPPDLDLEKHRGVLAGARLTLVVGSEDQYIDEHRLQLEQARLRAHGIPYELLRFDGPHRLDEATLQRLGRSPVGGAPQA
jgi:predicted esterase